MKKIIAILLCGYAAAAFGLTSGEMDDLVSQQTAIPETRVKSALDAYEEKLKSEAAAGRAVKMEGFGTMMPRSVQGTRTGRTLGGGTVTYQNWKLVKNPETVSDATLYTPEDEAIISAYKRNVQLVMRKGGTYTSRGMGSFKAGRLASTKTKPARMVAKFSSSKSGMHQKFVPDNPL